MENLDKTMFTNNEDDLQKIFEEEASKLQINQRKIEILRKMSLDDFAHDLPENSKKKIEKALLAVKIKDHINMDNGLKVLGLENFDVNKINLSYNEKKLIQERFDHMLQLEKLKNSQAPHPTDELEKIQEKFVEIQKENIELTEKLADLRQQELELMKQVAEALASPIQKLQVEKILSDSKITQLQISVTNQAIQENEMTKTSHVKKALTEVTGYVDKLLQKKEEKREKV